MAKVEKKMPYVTPDGITIQGRLITDTATGASEWYAPGASFPTFVSDKNQNGDFNWKPHTDQSLDNLTKVTVPLYGKPVEKAQKYNTAGIVDLFVETDAEKLSDQIAETMNNPKGNSFESFNETRAQSIEDEGSDSEREQFLKNPSSEDLVPGSQVDFNEAADKANDIATGLASIEIIPGVGISDENFSNLRYPEKLDPSSQDYINITVITYGKKTLNLSGGQVGFTDREFTTGNTVTLPIQSGIKDQNMAKWSGQEMDVAQAGMAAASMGIMEGGAKGGAEAAKGAAEIFKTAGVSDAIATALAEKASGAQGLLSRLAGAIANPNLELLFQGPELRPFSLSFFMSPRSPKEAENVRKIIRFFKQHMAVKRSSSGVFLKAPDVFRVQYMSSGGKEHGAINRFKECALLQMSVDYTPGGSYSTFNDEKHTMTAYRLDLSFQELEPVFADEYDPGSGKYPKMSTATPAVNEIGY